MQYFVWMHHDRHTPAGQQLAERFILGGPSITGSLSQPEAEVGACGIVRTIGWRADEMLP